MTTSEWLRDTKKLGVSARTLERGTVQVNELEGEHRDITRTREDAFETTKKRLQYFKASLQDIQDRLADVTKFRSHSGALQKSLETFESKLTSYKGTMRSEFDSLANDEIVLEKDLDFFFSRVDSWVKSDGSANNSGSGADESPSRASKGRTTDRYERHVQLQSKIGSIDRQVGTSRFLAPFSLNLYSLPSDFRNSNLGVHFHSCSLTVEYIHLISISIDRQPWWALWALGKSRPRCVH